MSTHSDGLDPGLDFAFHRLHHDETTLATQFIQLGEQHPGEHEIHHVTRDLLNWSHDHLARIIETATSRHIRLNPDRNWPGTAAASLPSTAVNGPLAPPGLRLLEDLRTTYLLASAASLSWELLAQYAQARHATDVLDLTARCHPQTLRQLRWANTMLKTQSPQTLTSLQLIPASPPG